MALLLPLAACSQANERICYTPDAVPAVGDWKGCVHRWSYRLAVSSDPAPQVAQAVVGGCEEAVISGAISLPDDEGGYLKDAMDEARRLALFHVIQARAGHCAIP